jgi:hypothetical protein
MHAVLAHDHLVRRRGVAGHAPAGRRHRAGALRLPLRADAIHSHGRIMEMNALIVGRNGGSACV